MKTLLKAFIQHISHYNAVLPYNLSWQLKRLDIIHDFLLQNPLVVVDVGGRGGTLGEIENLRKYIKYITFDADLAEVSQLERAAGKGFHSYEVYPYYVGDRCGRKKFFLFKNPGESSGLKPNPEYKENFAHKSFTIDRVSDVQCITLDSFIKKERGEYPDIIKLDTQGTEFEIISASPQSVDMASLIEVEVEFYPMYEGQALFYDVGKFLYENGYQLLYLNRVFMGRKKYNGETRGQIVFGDALFGKRENLVKHFEEERKAKYVISLMNYGHLDLAYQLLQENSRIVHLIPDIYKHFKLYRGILSKIRRVSIMQLDKFIAFLLYLRRTNQIRFESDRSWPIR